MGGVRRQTALSQSGQKTLAEMEERDSLFAEIDPGLWAQR